MQGLHFLGVSHFLFLNFSTKVHSNKMRWNTHTHTDYKPLTHTI